jgi:cytochrome c-type biogenesis protein CcmE
MKSKYIIGLAVIVFFSGFAVYSFRSALNPYMTFRQAAGAAGTVQVIGYLTDDGVAYDPDSGLLRFFLADEEGTLAEIAYAGTKPTNLEHAESIVVVGQFEGDIFYAGKILVKCPSKYEAEKGRD